LLADLIREAKSNGQPVYALAFHVGYWDGLGWKDPFSDPAYTQRQLNYAAALKLDDVYTPQMIVNGTAQFVGSDRQAAREAIDRALRQSASAAVEFQAVQSHSAQSQAGNDGPGRPIDLTYRAAGPKGAVLNVAVVEGSLRVDVPRGENGGRQLEHENVVRWFKTIDLPEGGNGSLTIPALPQIKPENAAVVVYVQEASQGAILGAAARAFPLR
jgi:hypothetical protein